MAALEAAAGPEQSDIGSVGCASLYHSLQIALIASRLPGAIQGAIYYL